MQSIRNRLILRDNSSKYRARIDIVLILLVYAITIFGVFAVSVASFSINSNPEGDIFNQIVGSHYGLRQAVFMLISPIVLGFIVAIPYDYLRNNVMTIYFLSIGLLVVALLGEAVAGINAFISIFWGLTIQPAEFAKIAIIVLLASQLENLNDPFKTVKSSIKFLITVGSPALITIMQGEMGSAIVMAAIVLVMLFVAGMPWKRFLLLIAFAGMAMVGLVLFWSLFNPDSYRLQRIIALVNPDAASEAAKYQVNNSMIAVGTGGLKGIGPFKEGSIAQLDYVPKDWTDFIFSTIGEAFGFIGCVAVIALYVLIIFRLMYLARTSLNRFSELVIIGIMTLILVHVFLNIGMTIGLVPVVGIPLPFLSYGGSNLFTNMIGIGLVLNVTKNRKLSKTKYDSSYIEKHL